MTERQNKNVPAIILRAIQMSAFSQVHMDHRDTLWSLLYNCWLQIIVNYWRLFKYILFFCLSLKSPYQSTRAVYRTQKSAIITTRLLRRAAQSLFSSSWNKNATLKIWFPLLFRIKKNSLVGGGTHACYREKIKHILISVSLNTNRPVEPNESLALKSGKIYKQKEFVKAEISYKYRENPVNKMNGSRWTRLQKKSHRRICVS